MDREAVEGYADEPAQARLIFTQIGECLLQAVGHVVESPAELTELILARRCNSFVELAARHEVQDVAQLVYWSDDSNRHCCSNAGGQDNREPDQLEYLAQHVVHWSESVFDRLPNDDAPR